MEPWAPTEPCGSSSVLEEQLNRIPNLDLRQDMPPAPVSKSFLSTSQTNPIPSDLAPRTPVLLPEPGSENPTLSPLTSVLGTPVLPEPGSECPASAQFPRPPSPS